MQDDITFITKLKNIMHYFRKTPIHPQWFTYLDEVNVLSNIGSCLKENILDIGCGKMRLKPYIINNVNYIGLDYLKTAQLYGTSPNIYANGQFLPFKNDSFTDICLLEVMEHVPEPDLVLKEAFRILKPNGTVYFTAPFMYPIHDAPYDYQRWTRFGIINLAKDAGFSITSIKQRGTPIQTSALFYNIALTRITLSYLKNLNPLGIILIIIAPVMIFLNNILAILISKITSKDEIMPFGYAAIFVKESSRDTN